MKTKERNGNLISMRRDIDEFKLDPSVSAKGVKPKKIRRLIAESKSRRDELYTALGRSFHAGDGPAAMRFSEAAPLESARVWKLYDAIGNKKMARKWHRKAVKDSDFARQFKRHVQGRNFDDVTGAKIIPLAERRT